MIALKDILYKVNMNTVVGQTSVNIDGITFDSRHVKPNMMFVAIVGQLSNGHDYIEKAVALGAKAIVCEQLPKNTVQGVTYIEVDSTNKALAIMASNYYKVPSKYLSLVGVTGTNGKTTVATLLYQLFKKAGYKVGLISTVKIMVDEEIYKTNHTTPDSLTINYYLNLMHTAGVDYCFMEVSSHGIDQHRTTALHFKGGIFTNLTHDHLDYHKTFSEYRDVKKSFFDNLPETAFALVNADDKNGEVMLQNTKAQKVTYALKSYAQYKAQILENQFSGLLLKINNAEVWTQLIGAFNAYNLLAIFATADLLGLETSEILKYISALKNVDGRFEYTISDQKIIAIIDYAHTPDALKNVLETINTIKTKEEQLITVVGCGGDRDKSKRPKMGAIAATLSNKVIFTSDNPRSEDPETILTEIESGVTTLQAQKTLRISDRAQAIKTACQLALPGDIILVAGKGHETYQEIKGERTHFNDFEMVNQFLKQLKK